MDWKYKSYRSLYNLRNLFFNSEYKLINGIKKILNSSKEDLRRVDYVQKIIQEIGICWDIRRYVYGKDLKYMNKSDGLFQIPRQLAEFLVELSNHKINSFLDIGTWNGWTSAIITAYLSKFNKNLQAITIDIENLLSKSFKIKIERLLLPYKSIQANSFRFNEMSFDLVFIDGEHTYKGVSRDYKNVGKYAKLCAFHDINNKSTPDVKRFWDELEGDKKEFRYHSEGENYMGIGLLKPTKA